MKKLSVLLAWVALSSVSTVSAAWACDGGGSHSKTTSCNGKNEPSLILTQAAAETTPGVSTATFQVKGMSCSSCQKKIQASLMKLNGVKAVVFKKHVTVVTYANQDLNPAALIKAIEDAGYTASQTRG